MLLILAPYSSKLALCPVTHTLSYIIQLQKDNIFIYYEFQNYYDEHEYAVYQKTFQKISAAISRKNSRADVYIMVIEPNISFDKPLLLGKVSLKFGLGMLLSKVITVQLSASVE